MQDCNKSHRPLCLLVRNEKKGQISPTLQKQKSMSNNPFINLYTTLKIFSANLIGFDEILRDLLVEQPYDVMIYYDVRVD